MHLSLNVQILRYTSRKLTHVIDAELIPGTKTMMTVLATFVVLINAPICSFSKIMVLAVHVPTTPEQQIPAKHVLQVNVTKKLRFS